MTRARNTMDLTASAVAGIEDEPSDGCTPTVARRAVVLPPLKAPPAETIEVDPNLMPQVERITRRSLDVVEAILRKDPNAVDAKELSILKDTAMGWINTRVKLKAAEIQSARSPDRLAALLRELRDLSAAHEHETRSRRLPASD